MISSSDNKNNIANVKLAEYIPVSAVEKEDRAGWVNYGVRNTFPSYLIELAESSPVHGSLCTSIAQMIAGKEISGILPADQERLKLNKLVHPTASDLKLQGGYYWEIVWTLDRRAIASITPYPFECMRIAIDKETGEEIGAYYSMDWSDYKKGRNKPIFLPMFDPNTPRIQDAPLRQVFYKFANRRGSQYYGKPDYLPSVNWIELSRQMGMYHVNNIMNGFFPSFILNFFNGIPDPDTKSRLIADFENKISGARNAGKAMFTFNESGTDAPKIETFPLSEADKQYAQLMTDSTQQIMIAHRVTSPLLFGIRDSSGLGSNADEIRQSFAIFESQVIQPYQELIEEGLAEVMSVASVNILPFVPGMSTEAVPSDGETTGAPASADVASQALNGAQIASLVDILMQAAAGAIPKSSAMAIVQASFPTLSQDQINAIFRDVVSGSLTPEEVIQRAVMSAEKKKTTLAIPDSFAPTNEMAAEAELGLKWREEYGRGGTEVGVARARDISNKRNLSYDTIKRMNSYFSRHEVDKKATGWNQGEEGFPTAGRIAWQLWGGDPGRDWSARIVERYKDEELQSERRDLTDEEYARIIERMKECGEKIDLDEWELVFEEDACHDHQSEIEAIDNLKLETMASLESYANGDEKSAWGDSGLYKLRYAYSQNLSENSRDFCVDMVGLSRAGYVYRYEDIQEMGDDGVNGSFAPAGSSTYDIFTWKGGVYCHHFWKRQIYFRKTKNGRFLPNKGLENDKRVGNVPFVPRKGEEGVAPINTPSRGSLKNP